MVEVLLIEDSADKRDEIIAEVRSFFGSALRSIECSECFADATKAILERRFDLIITDLLLPRRKNGEPEDFSEDLLEYLSESELNSSTIAVAISKFGEIVSNRQDSFTRQGIFLIAFSNDGAWKQCLNVCMQRVAQTIACDFVIFCALDKERGAFRDVEGLEFGEFYRVASLDLCVARIGEFQGYIAVQPRMGLVDAAVTVTTALQVLKPKVIAMAGICGGFPTEVKLGTLVVSDICWDHQAGKWSGDRFGLRHYQEPINGELRVLVNQLILSDPDLNLLRSNLRELKRGHDDCVMIAPMVSGSFVLASGALAEDIRKQHGKLAALDMEVFGFHRAAALYGNGIKAFAAKTVVDLVDEGKADAIHRDGAILSARFVTKVLSQVLG